ncbi:hypothetical protein QOZ80_9AG0676470 [Eleusine coracana subsp. coracana]|nr:hypothetical protein QOZ80_9AG0676450 [Eleusine coracana subsp. coracana]KAK3119858.1 hypothetical protein QOZ80_9AG0676460 [Eleusine coracana subsp. coracana]KAK3119859.1 hypothetical protein QOZ80_9AG0676470 [Eleusine coracana subsp. coracana]
MVVPVKIGAYGGYGSGQNPGRDEDLNVSPRAIYTITVRSTAGSKGISAISFVYKAADGTTISVGPWGTNASGSDSLISIKEGEYVVEVSGTYDNNCVTSLAIITNFTTYNYGKDDSGIPFKVPVKNGKIVGFFGNAGTSGLNSLGVYVVPRE